MEQAFACRPLFVLLGLVYAAIRLLTVLVGYSPKQPYVLSSALCTCSGLKLNSTVLLSILINFRLFFSDRKDIY